MLKFTTFLLPEGACSMRLHNWNQTWKSCQFFHVLSCFPQIPLLLSHFQLTPLSQWPGRQAKIPALLNIHISYDISIYIIHVYIPCLRKDSQRSDSQHICFPLRKIKIMSEKPGGGFKYFSCSPLLGEDVHFESFWLIFFELGWNHQPEKDTKTPMDFSYHFGFSLFFPNSPKNQTSQPWNPPGRFSVGRNCQCGYRLREVIVQAHSGHKDLEKSRRFLQGIGCKFVTCFYGTFWT